MTTLARTARYAKRTAHLRASTIREMLKVTQQPDVISFGGGLPAPELFPLKAVADCTAEVLEHYGASALQYSVTEGIPALRTATNSRLPIAVCPSRRSYRFQKSSRRSTFALRGSLRTERSSRFRLHRPRSNTPSPTVRRPGIFNGCSTKIVIGDRAGDGHLLGFIGDSRSSLRRRAWCARLGLLANGGATFRVVTCLG